MLSYAAAAAVVFLQVSNADEEDEDEDDDDVEHIQLGDKVRGGVVAGLCLGAFGGTKRVRFLCVGCVACAVQCQGVQSTC